MAKQKGHSAWENLKKEEAENNRRQYQFWEKKLHIAISRGDEEGIEDAKKHLEYWIALI